MAACSIDAALGVKVEGSEHLRGVIVRKVIQEYQYPLDPSVVTGLSLQIQPDGSILCQASDFTSARTGLRYRFCGYLIQVSTGNLVTVNPYTIPAADCAKTLRIMYATVAP